MKKNRGITLVALVVTIVILLILAGVTIAMVLGQNGIFRKAEIAKQKTEIEQRKEEIKLAWLTVKVENNGDISKVTNEQLGQQMQIELRKIDTNATAVCNMEKTEITGRYKEKSYRLDINSGSVSLVEEEQKVEELKTKAEPGDYVQYIVEEKEFTVMDPGGSSSNYNTGSYTGTWQILYNDEEHGLQIISTDGVIDYFTLSGKLGYNNAVNTLNEFCRHYINTQYAFDARCVGSNPTNPNDATNIANYTTTWGKTTDYKIGEADNPADYKALLKADKYDPEGIAKCSSAYWMASRLIVESEAEANLGIRAVDRDGNTIDRIDLYLGNYLVNIQKDREDNALIGSASYSIRPIIYLKNDIKINGGTGTQQNPYKLISE